MAKITYEDKENIKPVGTRKNEATADDFNEIKDSVNILYDELVIDNSTEYFYLLKGVGETTEDGALKYNPVLDRNESLIPFYAPTVITDPATIEVGEGLNLSAAGVLLLARSRLTGKKYLMAYREFDDTGSYDPFTIGLVAEDFVEVQSVYTQDTPLTGMFTAQATENEVINDIN